MNGDIRDHGKPNFSLRYETVDTTDTTFIIVVYIPF